jgi:hypothetical protein
MLKMLLFVGVLSLGSITFGDDPPAAPAESPTTALAESRPFALKRSADDALSIVELRKLVAKLRAENADLRKHLARAMGGQMPADPDSGNAADSGGL